LAGYLQGFVTASKGAFERVYIDGFASSGKGIDPRTGTKYDGSALLCLGVNPSFTDCYFVEKDPARAEALAEVTASYPHAHVFAGDANEEIPKILARVNRKAPALAFSHRYVYGTQADVVSARRDARDRRAYLSQLRPRPPPCTSSRMTPSDRGC
jgi:three-Cys-motif partner protein